MNRAARAARILSLLAERADEHGIVRGISARELGKAAGMPRTGARDAVERLIDMGLIVVAERGRSRRPPVYRLAGHVQREPSPSHGIETVERGGITLPRLRCLEREMVA